MNAVSGNFSCLDRPDCRLHFDLVRRMDPHLGSMAAMRAIRAVRQAVPMPTRVGSKRDDFKLSLPLAPAVPALPGAGVDPRAEFRTRADAHGSPLKRRAEVVHERAQGGVGCGGLRGSWRRC